MGSRKSRYVPRMPSGKPMSIFISAAASMDDDNKHHSEDTKNNNATQQQASFGACGGSSILSLPVLNNKPSSVSSVKSRECKSSKLPTSSPPEGGGFRSEPASARTGPHTRRKRNWSRKMEHARKFLIKTHRNKHLSPRQAKHKADMEAFANRHKIGQQLLDEVLQELVEMERKPRTQQPRHQFSKHSMLALNLPFMLEESKDQHSHEHTQQHRDDGDSKYLDHNHDKFKFPGSAILSMPEEEDGDDVKRSSRKLDNNKQRHMELSQHDVDNTNTRSPKQQTNKIPTFSWIRKVVVESSCPEDRLERAACHVQDGLGGGPKYGKAYAHGLDPITRWCLKTKNQVKYRLMLYMTIACHMLLMLVEPSCSQTPTTITLTTLVVLDFCCVSIYAVNCMVEVGSIGLINVCRSVRHVPGFILVMVMVIDTCMSAAALPNASVRFSLPLRPLLLIFWDLDLFRVSTTVVMTLRNLGALAVVVLIVMILYAFLGVRLFTGLYPPLWEAGADFDSFPTAMISLFVLLTTENYPQCLYPAFDRSKWSILYFWSYISICVVLIMAAVVGTFIDSYRETISIAAVLERKEQIKCFLEAFDLVCEPVEVLDDDESGGRPQQLLAVHQTTLWKLAKVVSCGRISDVRTKVLIDLCCDISSDDNDKHNHDSDKHNHDSDKNGGDAHASDGQFLKFCGNLGMVHSARGMSSSREDVSKNSSTVKSSYLGRSSGESMASGNGMIPRPVRASTSEESYDIKTVKASTSLTSLSCCRCSPLRCRWRSCVYICQSRVWQLVNMFVIFLNVVFIAFYSEQNKAYTDTLLRYTNVGFLGLAWLRVIVEILAGNGRKEMFDACTVSVCTVLQIVVVVVQHTAGVYSYEIESLVHMLLVLRVLTLDSFRLWLFSLYRLFFVLAGTYWRVILNLVLLMTLISYSFASLGNLAFCGVLDSSDLPGDLDGDYRETRVRQSFDTLAMSMMTMFQVFTSNNWNDIMFAVENATNLASTLFFISFFICINICIVNLFVALIADMVTAHWRQGKQGDSEREMLFERLSTHQNTTKGGLFDGVQTASQALNNTDRKHCGLGSHGKTYDFSSIRKRSLVRLLRMKVGVHQTKAKGNNHHAYST